MGGMAGLDSWLIQITKGKLLKLEILHLTVYIDYYCYYYFNGKYFVIIWPKLSGLPGDADY